MGEKIVSWKSAIAPSKTNLSLKFQSVDLNEMWKYAQHPRNDSWSHHSGQEKCLIDSFGTALVFI